MVWAFEDKQTAHNSETNRPDTIRKWNQPKTRTKPIGHEMSRSHTRRWCKAKPSSTATTGRASLGCSGNQSTVTAASTSTNTPHTHCIRILNDCPTSSWRCDTGCPQLKENKSKKKSNIPSYSRWQGPKTPTWSQSEQPTGKP
jgi:hypothetical protein